MADPFAAADYFGDDAAPTPPLSPRPALFPAPSAEEVAEAQARKEAAAATPARKRLPPAPKRPSPAPKRPKQRGLRVGAWSDEEVAYAERVSDLYRQGKLPNCPEMTTLRSLLATLLNCQPMRISKKKDLERWANRWSYRHVGPRDAATVDGLLALEKAFHRALPPFVTLHTALLGTSGLPPPAGAVRWRVRVPDGP